jgi:dipeptidyl aminopeptidase/acylaminoacyl peptidase
MTRPITAEDLWKLPRVDAPAVSSDGSTIVVPVTHYDLDSDEGTTVLYELGAGDPTPLTDGSESATSPAISKDGATIAFLAKDEDGHHQVHLLSRNGGETRKITDLPLGATGPKWLPDGRLIVVVKLTTDAPTIEGTRAWKESKRLSSARITEDRVYRFWDTWLTDGETWHPFVLDPSTGDLADLTPGRNWWWRLPTQGDQADAYDISPNGSEISFSAWEIADQSSVPVWRIYSVGIGGGEVTCLTPESTGDASWPRYTSDGAELAYLFQREPDYYADRRRLAIIDRATDQHRVLTEGWDNSTLTVTPAGTGFVITAEKNTAPCPIRSRRPMAPSSFDIRASLNRLNSVGSIRPMVPSRESPTSQQGSSRTSSSERSRNSPSRAPKVTRSRYSSSIRPKRIQIRTWHFRWNAQAFAAPGYVVAMVNFHGSTSFGDSFARSIHGRWGDQPTVDILAATESLIERGIADPERMAITGGSYGGYLTAWMMSQTDRFRCAIAHAAVTNLGGMYATDMTYGFSRSRGAETPTLVIHGERDYRVPVTQGLELYGVLKSKGVPARLVYFPDENHWILKPQNSLVWYQEVHDWLAQWLAE